MICNKRFYFIVKTDDDGKQKPTKTRRKMHKKILIIDDHDDLATALQAEFSGIGHQVMISEGRNEGISLLKSEEFDVIITDLEGEELAPEADQSANEECLPEEVADSEPRGQIKAFKICITNYKSDAFSEDELKQCVKTTLNYKARCIDKKNNIQNLHEKIEFEVPSYISLMHDILDYLMKRVEKLGVVNLENSNLFVALDEAFVNAVKHGNKFNAEKLVRITADVSREEARFTIEDEGEGFDVNAIPDPTNPENLFKTSGRGVLFIHNIMDEVTYNERGNRLTMIKKSDNHHESNHKVS